MMGDRQFSPLSAQAAFEVLLAVENLHLDRALGEINRRFKLRAEDRLLVKQWVHLILRQRGKIDAVLRSLSIGNGHRDELEIARLAAGIGLDPSLPSDMLPLLGQIAPKDKGAQTPGSAQTKLNRLYAIAEAAAADRLKQPNGSPLADFLSHPQWMLERLQSDFPDEDLGELLEANNAAPPVTLRANTLKIERGELQRRLQAEGIETRFGKYSPFALHVHSPSDVFRTEAFAQGLFELQDEGSQLLGWVADPKPKGLIIDACAGAGGKTLLMAAMLRNRARILAADVYANKLERLRERARRAGVSNTETLALAGGELPVHLRHAATTVLVDAPCSGLGALRRNPDAKWKLTPQAPTELAARQQGLLHLWAGAVAPGGLLVYTTCTLTREENEEVVQRFLMGHPEFRLEDACSRFAEHGSRFQTREGFFRSFPHRDGTDGFFGARLRRNNTPGSA